MTDALKKTINAAMERTGGNIAHAALLAAIPLVKFKNHIFNCPSLRERWSGGKLETTPPNEEVAAVHRPVIDLPPSAPAPSLEEVAAALDKEDQLVLQGLSSIGISGPKLDMVDALRKFHGRHFKTSLELIGGGITKEFIDIMSDVRSIRDELSHEGMELGREIMLRQDRATLLELMGKIYDRANKAALTQAMIKMKEGEGKNRAGKPGFSPMIKAKNVQVNVKG